MFVLRVNDSKYLELKEIISRSYSENAIYAFMLTEDERRVLLRYDEKPDSWTTCLIPLRSGDEYKQGDAPIGNIEWARSMRKEHKKLPDPIITRAEISVQMKESYNDENPDYEGPQEAS